MSFIQNVKNEILAHPPKNQIQRYAADVFLVSASGSIKRGYQVNFTFDNIDDARSFADILAAYDIFPKLSSRNGNTIVYIKSRECMCNLLALVGTNKSLMQLNNEIALRELRNDANRRTNCDTHNIEKAVSVANKQLEVIKTLNFNNLDEKLREIAKARLDYPDASYEELSKIIGLSKSGVVNRLRRLQSLSD